MQAIYFEAPGQLSYRESDPLAITQPTAALVRPLAVATCDLDTAMLRGQAPHPRDPFPFGHEAVAKVIDVGDASGTREGLRYAIARTDLDGACTSASTFFEPVELPLLQTRDSAREPVRGATRVSMVGGGGGVGASGRRRPSRTT